MDPLNWAHRWYLIQAIQECGFEGGWQPIIEKIQQLCSTLLPPQTPAFNYSPNDCHIWYLQVLAEFGDFRKLSDPLTPPSQEIIDKIKRMRRSQLRHELLITNNQIRYNNYILKHHKEEVKLHPKLSWVRFNTADSSSPPTVPNPLVQICIDLKERDWYNALPTKGLQGKKVLNLEDVLGRCISGVITEPLEFVRDIIHMYTDYSICSLSEREKTAVEKLKHDALQMIEPYIKDDERWNRIREFVV